MPGTKPRIFLDSNVIYSGLYSPKGAPGIILEHFISSRIDVVISQQVLEEVIRTIKEKLPGALPALKRLLLNKPPHIIADPKPGEVERWARKLPLGDAAVLAAALSAKPDYFVTGDNHFVENPAIGEDAGLHIVTPAQLIKLLKKANGLS